MKQTYQSMSQLTMHHIFVPAMSRETKYNNKFTYTVSSLVSSHFSNIQFHHIELNFHPCKMQELIPIIKQYLSQNQFS